MIPDDIKALAEAQHCTRLIIKTSSSIHDVQAAQVVREILDSTPIDGSGRRAAVRPRSGRRRRASRPARASSAGRHAPRGRPMFRRLQAIALATILVVAAFSTGYDFLFYLLSRHPGDRRVLRPRPLGLSDLEAGCGQPAARTRRRPDAVTYTLRNSSRLPKPWLEIHNPTTLPGGLPDRRSPAAMQSGRG